MMKRILVSQKSYRKSSLKPLFSFPICIAKMQNFPASPKTHAHNRLINFVILSCFVCVIYLLVSFVLVPSTKHHQFSASLQDLSSTTSLEHIVFGIASNDKSWLRRKEYVRQWWRPLVMRGCVFLDTMPTIDNTIATSDNDTISLPPVCISNDTSQFRYTYRNGLRSAIRVARVVAETVALNHYNVRWFVFGDDDTIFFAENLLKTLSKYDHSLWYYIGSNSESFTQNKFFSHNMAFGGAGFAISYPLAKVLARVFDSCLKRYPHLYGSDGRIHACLTELGVELTREPGFHQMDFRGNMFGLLASHPIRPLVSLHHLDVTDPIFPNMTRLEALSRLFEATSIDSQRILQQTVCYHRWFSWTISVSWGYAVQVFRNHLSLLDATRTQETFMPWKRGRMGNFYSLDTLGYHPHPCQRPVVFFFERALESGDGIMSIYKIMTSENCSSDMTSLRKLREIWVYSKKLDLDIQQLQAPRRHCCDVLNSSVAELLEIGIRECNTEELIHMHA